MQPDAFQPGAPQPGAPQPLHRVSISLLGGLFVQHADQPAVALSPQQTSSLLAYLALNMDRVTPRVEIAVLLWPETEHENAYQNLRQCLRTLRRVLEPDPWTPGSALLATRTDVRLNPEKVHTDVSGFSAALDAANAATEAAERVKYLHQAIELYRGELLPGYYLDYFISEQRRLAERHLQALHDLTRELDAAGDSERALKYAQRAAILDPTSDTACISLMRVYASLGQGSAVTREFQQFEERYRKDFGEPPSPLVRDAAAHWREVAQQRADDRTAQPTSRRPPSRRERSQPVLEPALPQPSSARPLTPPKVTAAAAACLFVVLLASFWFWSFSHRQVRGPSSLGTAGTPVPAIEGIQPAQEVASVALCTTEWVRVYDPQPDEKNSEASCIALDLVGNVYVTGFVRTATRDVDYLTVKYDPKGNMLWRRTYNGPGNDVDRARKVVVDKDGNVIVTGDSDNGKGNGATRLCGLDIATIKYDANGTVVWVRRFNGKDDGEDRPAALDADGAGAVYVLGQSWETATSHNRAGFGCALVKYTKDGTEEWVAHYSNRCGFDAPAAMVRDKDNSIYAAVTSQAAPSGGAEADIVGVKFDPAGHLMWKVRYGAANHADDVAIAIGLDHDRITIFGRGRGPVGTPDADRAGAITIFCDPAGHLSWARGAITNADRIDKPYCACIAPMGVSITCGLAWDRKGERVVRTVLREADGMPRWTRDYRAIIPDGAISVTWRGEDTYVCGVFTQPGNGAQLEALLYSPTGSLDRRAVYRPPSELGGTALVVLDETASPIVACQQLGPIPKMAVIRFHN